MSLLQKTLRVLSWIILVFFLLVVVFGVSRLIQVAYGSLYTGERGPYLQMASSRSMTVRWQTLDSYQGVVRYGLSPDYLSMQAMDTTSDTSHEVRLIGLKPATRYYYAVGKKDQIFSSNKNQWFLTSPNSGQDTHTRFLVLGDPGLNTPNQAAVLKQSMSWLNENIRTGRAAMDLLLTTGDNAYTSGRNEEFQQHFFIPLKNILLNTPVWPVYGNHDARRWSFFKIFSFPQHGEAGGITSGTEHYYSFDYGPVHFVVLDSEDSRWNYNHEMVQWLHKDLQANQLPWVVSLFHHPPYSKGSHNSDSRRDSRGRMFDMRENILPVLESYGVDLVLTGHSHVYERSYLLDCHYGTSDTLQDSMILSRHKQDYQKRSLKKGQHEGAIYAVVGSTAKSDYGTIDHPVMANALMEYGALVVDIHGNRLDARFISSKGILGDRFSITKGVAKAPVGSCKGGMPSG